MYGDNSHNPMRWDCQRQGCFNEKKRLKFGVFKDCLPGKISFTDVDALVERNGNLLFMEWKEHQELSKGQRILFERMTLFSPAVVLVVEGDAESMTVSSMRTVWQGKIAEPEPADLDILRATIRQWSDWATDNPMMLQPQEAACL